MQSMVEFLTRFALAGAAVLFTLWLVLANRGRIARATDALAKVSRARIAAFLVFVAIATVCAQKPGGGVPPSSQGGDPPRSGGLEATETTEVTNLCFTGISVTSNEAVLSLAWSADFLPDGSCLDFFAKAGSLTNRWEWIGCQSVAAGETNLEVSVVLASLPGVTNAPTAAFFRVADRATDAATMRDRDGDGIPDIYELHNGTNPYMPDAAFAPRLIVGAGGDYADLVAALAASTNYFIVSLPAGEFQLPNWIVMPEHPVMVTGPEDGYAVVRSTANIASFVLDAGQTEETLFRNLIVVLEHAGGFLAGFWIGGNLPWSGVGASPTFENVRIRAPRPGTLYYGWHYYRDDGGTSSLTNCVMNAAGAEVACGVYSYGGPEVEMSGCAFLNFPTNGGSYATYFHGVTNTLAWGNPSEQGLSWAGYPLDAEYSTEEDSDDDGISDYDEIFEYDTDPWLADSDGDGVSDGDEVDDGTDPRVFGSFLRHVTIVATADDSLSGVTNYMAWGVAAHGWETNDVAAFAASPGTNEFTVANSNAAVYAKAYRDMNRNGEYDDGADILLVKAIPEFSAPTILFAFGDVDGDGISDVQELAEGTDPYDAGNFRLALTVVFENSDASAAATNLCECGTVAAWLGSGAVAFAQTASVAVDVIVTNGIAYAKCMRDFNADGECDEDHDVLYARTLTKADNGKTVAVSVGDRDTDGIPDGEEIAEGTNPCDAKSYCFNLTLVETGVIRTTNDLSVVVKLGDEVVYGPATATNRTFEADVGHVVITNGGSVTVYFWDDANTNGVRDAEEPCTTQQLLPNGHESVVTNTFQAFAFDRDRDGMLDWWEELHADAGLSPTNSADAWLDPDGDGLINLHEYWADCDPLVYDGTNTAIYAAVHSVDDGITDRDPELSMPIYVNYKDNARTNNPPVAIVNTNSWAASMLHGCFSLWSDDRGAFYMNEMNPISPYHVVMASHCGNPLNIDYKFMGLSGAWYTRQLIGKIAIPKTDITIGIVNEVLPTNDLKTVYLLPGNYSDYLGTLVRLPVVQVDQDKLAIVQEITRTVTPANRYYEFECSRSLNDLRHPFGFDVKWHDSGSPCYVVIGNVPVLLYAVHARSNVRVNGAYAGIGYHTALFCDEIQSTMNELSDAKNLPRVGINFFDFSQYEQLRNWR